MRVEREGGVRCKEKEREGIKIQRKPTTHNETIDGHQGEPSFNASTCMRLSDMQSGLFFPPRSE
jgi:hypothetical protein